MPKEWTPQYRRPTSDSPNTLADKNLLPAGQSLGVSKECATFGECRLVTLFDASFAPTLLYIAERWPLLPPHIREEVLALVDAGKCKHSAEENRHEFS
jgi:hypothetical protein